MSADDSRNEQRQQNQADKMSATTQDPPKEVRPAVPTFSYAQAAKGKAPSVPATPSVNIARSDPSENEAKKDTTSETTTAKPDAQNITGKRTTSEGGKPQGEDFKATGEHHSNHNGAINGAVKGQWPGTQSALAVSAPETTSTSPSPDFGTTSISTLPKEDDGFSAVNESSDSTWDKQSQSSQNGSKHGEKANSEKENTQKASEPSWDEEKPEAIALKEAPPPPVNFWKQRMAATPKIKPQQSAPAQISKPTALTNGVSNAGESAKPNEVGGESKKAENKRKARGNAEDRPPAKEGSKSAEGKAKNGEGAIKATATTMAPPPPPGDAISWPTPDSAVEEEKRKSLNRVEKEDKEKMPSTKPHGKKEWQHVPFVPTVNFNTPLPTSRTRGGRGPGGTTRESGARGRNTNGVDKATSTSASPINQNLLGNDERGKAGPISSTASPTTQKPKRASSAGPTAVKELRKPGESSGLEKRKDADFTPSKASHSKGASTNESRRQSTTAVNEAQVNKGISGRGPVREAANPPKKPQNADDIKQAPDASVAQAPPRYAESERKGDVSVRPHDTTKEVQVNTTPRERGEGRPERGGRGGYRGRGGANFNPYNSHLPNGHGFSGPSSQFQQPMTGPPSRSFSNHERLASQSQGPSYQTAPQQSRAYRSNSRSHSIQHPYGRFSHQPHTGPPHLANLQTDLANTFGYPIDQPPGSMSAVPFNPYMMGPTIHGMVAVQIEYYFSVDNLCKDMYLRSNMNSQGYIPLRLIQNFNRIKQLTQDPGILQHVCVNLLNVIEYRVAEDGTDWVRKRGDWQQWVLDMEHRVPAARNDGPPLPTLAPLQPFQAYGPPQTFDEGHEMSPRSGAASVPPDNIQYQSLDGAAAPVNQVVTVPQQQQNGMHSSNQAPLSAAVSEFSPSVRSANNRVFSSPDVHAQETIVISDEEMDKFNITYRAPPADVVAPALPPFHSTSSRTFSNGSIDGTTISNELAKFAERQSRPGLNGDNPESADRASINRSRSPFSVGSPSRSATSTSSPPVLWFKDKEHLSRMNSLPTEYAHSPYPIFRQSAFSQRERAKDTCVYDMKVLYGFWPHFLIRNFNAHAYEDFHRMALEDQSTHNLTYGMKCLLQYYDEALLGKRTIPSDSIASDFVEIVKKESPDSDRPIFKKFRAAWRNGAWNAKNRSKISKCIDADLTAELDK